MEIIGLAGQAGVGKDYVARHFLAPLGYKQVAFAWPLKWRVMGTQGFDWDEVFLTKPPQARTALQLEGTEQGWMQYGESFWCLQLWGMLKTFRETWGFERFVITDVRFPHEVGFVKGLGGKLWLIEAPERVGVSALDAAQRQHASETSLSLIPREAWDVIIDNNPSASVPLFDQVEQALGRP